MEPRNFELTPEQKGMLASLCRDAGQPLSTLLAAITDALEELQEKERRDEQGTSNGHDPVEPAAMETPKPFWQKALEASQRIPEEDLERLPADLAVQGDHDASGLPHRSAAVLDIFREARAAIPEETWDTLPPDLAAQHDHYIYGTPKRPA